MDGDESSKSSYSTANTEPPHEMKKAVNQVECNENEGNNRQNRTDDNETICNIFLKVIFVLLSIPWLISIIFFSIFDTKCVVFEKASLINCSQDIFVPNPTNWVFAWLVMSILTSALLIVIIAMNKEKLNYQIVKLRKIWHKGSFWSLMILLLASSVFYFIRIIASRWNSKSLFINILPFVWLFVTAVVVCCLNYLPRVRWKKTKETGLPRCNLVSCILWWKDCLAKNSNFFIYWFALFVHFVEISCKLIALTFDAAQDVAPLIQNKFRRETGEHRAIMFAIGFSLAYHGRLLSFFWLKLFHGEKDLFDEPSEELVAESQSNDHRGPGGAREREEIPMKEIVHCVTSV